MGPLFLPPAPGGACPVGSQSWHNVIQFKFLAFRPISRLTCDDNVDPPASA
jgi:hypothetical protein